MGDYEEVFGMNADLDAIMAGYSREHASKEGVASKQPVAENLQSKSRPPAHFTSFIDASDWARKNPGTGISSYGDRGHYVEAVDLLIPVYQLQNDHAGIDGAQKSSSLPDTFFGYKQTHGVFGSEEWWEQIKNGSLKLHTARGYIVQVEIEDSGRYFSFTMISPDGMSRSFYCLQSDHEFDCLYSLGNRVEVDYVTQHLRMGDIVDCEVEIRLGIAG